MEIRRRSFIASSLGAAALIHTSGLSGFSQERRRRRAPRIGIQLYAVRYEFEKDVPGTIKKLAELGYDGVEFWGYGGTENVFKDWSAEDLRKLLDENNIRCCGIHISVNALQGDNLATTIKNCQTLGNRYLSVAAANDLMNTPESIKKFAGILDEAAVKLQENRIRVGYHCHGFDFKKVNGTSGWEMLYDQVSPAVTMQLDTGNCAEGGGDPIAMLKKYPGRAVTLHVKEYEGAPLTETNAVWKEILQICKEQHRTRWYIIEQGEAQGAGFEIAKESLASLRALLEE